MKIAVCVVAYNRVSSLNRLLVSLNKAIYPIETPLIISVDKSDSDEVGRLADSFEWRFGNKTVVKHTVNLGLRKHILQCGKYLNDYDGLIVLEDDIEVSPSFYLFAKQCVEKYYSNQDIAGISLYSFAVNYHNGLPFMPIRTESDVYMMKCAQSWGQVWMKTQWLNFIEWYQHNSEEFSDSPDLPHSICSWPKSSWLKYHTRYCIENNKYFIYPYESLTTNYSDKGEHSSKASYLYQVNMLRGVKREFTLNPTIKYDGFFENELLYDVLNQNEKQLCIDLYGEKHNRNGRRYYLTTKQLDYLVVSSYGMLIRPMETNVINCIDGDEIFLYDTSVPVKRKRTSSESGRINYLFNINRSLYYLLSQSYPIRVHIKSIYNWFQQKMR